MDIKEKFESVINTFNKNLESVEELLEFDQIILKICLDRLEELDTHLKENNFTNPVYRVENTIKALKQIKQNRTTKIKYRTISNQCLVLVVSHFASAIHDLFTICINYAFKNKLSNKLKKEEFKFSVVELAELGAKIEERIGEIISDKNNISFQDMKSISRAFYEYFDIEIPKTQNVNNIIIGQACRHAIVHSGEKVDNALQRQIKAAQPNDINLELIQDKIFHFENEQLKIVMTSMKQYLINLINRLEKNWDLKEQVAG